MTQFVVVAQEISSGKNLIASVVMDTREEAEVQMAYFIALAVPGFQVNLGQERRYRYSIMEYEA